MVPFLALPWMAVDAEGSTAGFGRLEGVVTSPVDGRGLPNVVVIVRPAPAVGSVRTTNPEAGGASAGRVDRTDRDGSFSFEELPPGLYSLDVIGERPDLPKPTSADHQWVWTQVASVIVVPGLTATERVTLLGPIAPPPQAPAEEAPGT